MVKDTSEIKEGIISFLKIKGPSLPVHIAREIESSSLFTSAFLSELISEKRIKTSHMKIGNSPLYFIPGQETLLENFSQHLNNKEKEAFSLLKEKIILKDSEQSPAIRVALRFTRDFAVPFKKNDEIFWRYFLANEKTLSAEEKIKEPKKEKFEKITQENKGSLGIFDEEKKQREKTKKTRKKKTSSKKNDKFFDEVKEFLNKKSIELKDILGFSRKEIILLVNEKGNKKILVALDKKRPDEKDIAKASKKAKEHNLPYLLLSKGKPLKKITKLIEDLKNLESLESL